MIVSHKIHVLLDAIYKDGTDLLKEHLAPAKVSIHPIPGAPKFQELNLRIVVDSKVAEELLEGLCSGVSSLEIEQIPPVIERDINT